MGSIPPVININGTSAEELLEVNLTACQKLTEAMTAMRKATPHGRDYPRGHEEYRKAYDEFYQNLAKVQEAYTYMHNIMLAVYDQRSFADKNKRRQDG